MKKYSTALFLSFCFSLLFAQESTAPQQYFTLGLSGGYSDKLSLFSIPITYSHQLLQVKGLFYAVGVRQNLAFGRSTFTINEKDALIDDLSNYSFNAMVGLEYKLNKAFVGFNIDLAGVNTGTRSYKTVGSDPVYKINPEHLNLAGVSGCTNNEFYLGYQFTESFAAKFGLSYYNMSLLYSNNKIDKTSSYVATVLPMLHIQYTMWQK